MHVSSARRRSHSAKGNSRDSGAFPKRCNTGPGLGPRQQRRWFPHGIGVYERTIRALAAAVAVAACTLLVWNTWRYFHAPDSVRIGQWYVLVTGVQVLASFVLAACYRPPRDVGFLPTITIVIPAYNESDHIAQTLDACMNVDYPSELLDIIVVDDGSTDDTLSKIYDAQWLYPEKIRCISFVVNRGKKAAMAAGIRACRSDILIFLDSDSMPARPAIRQIVQALADHQVGAVSGITYVQNSRQNSLTKIQMAHYFVNFQLLKSAESVLGVVSCCSGCFSAYRRAVVMPVLSEWEKQTYGGQICNIGDDRSLTNLVLKRGYRTRYDSSAEAWTHVPSRFSQFWTQQLRWKKSWCREVPEMLKHLWLTRPIAYPFFLISALAAVASPLIIVWNMLAPFFGGHSTFWYLSTVVLVALAYGGFHRALRRDKLGFFAFLGTFYYLLLSLQLLWAIVTINDGRWGTRGERTHNRNPVPRNGVPRRAMPRATAHQTTSSAGLEQPA